MNSSMAAGSFLSYFPYKNIILLFATVETIRAIYLYPIMKTLPDAPNLHTAPENTRPHERPTPGPRVLLILTAHFIILFANQAYISVRSLFISEIFGGASVSFTLGTSFLITAIATTTIMKYTTRYGRIISRTGWLLIAFSALIILGGELSHILLAVLTGPILLAAVLSHRHYIIKKLPSHQTANVLYANNALSKLSSHQCTQQPSSS